jgi:hypothetical protein
MARVGDEGVVGVAVVSRDGVVGTGVAVVNGAGTSRCPYHTQPRVGSGYVLLVGEMQVR